MTSADGRYTVVFNGEIYNFEALRSELGAHGEFFRGRSDTEVLLRAMSAWGIERAIPRLWGMFAFALWDSAERRLHLVRDRLGKKPLYYGWFGDHLLFGSELKALRAHRFFSAEVDRTALANYLRFAYVPSPLSIYEGVRKLPPGSWLTVDPNRPGFLPAPKRYWDPAEIARAGEADPLNLSDADAIDELERLLADATQLRAVADVPLGAFLSGGIDSSAVVASLQAQSNRRVATFTIGSPEDSYDESGHASAIARHLGTDHTELIVTPSEARAVVPLLPSLYDEPFADSSQIPTFLVSQLARRHVTVALSGDGGDEVFGGYNRHVAGPRMWSRLRPVPMPLRRALARGIQAVPPGQWDRLGLAADRFLPANRRGVLTGNNAHKFAGVADVASVNEMYARLISLWTDASSVLTGGGTGDLGDGESLAPDLDPARQMMLLDLVTYLPDDILVKVDRASMGVSLEARTPLLDHRLVEFAFRLPHHQIIRGGEGKWLLRRVLERHVPRSLLDRPKKGFGIPIDAWLRGPLREWAEELLSPSRLAREGFFQVAPVQQALRAHLDGRRNLQHQLWVILMFEAWLDREHEEGRCS